LEIGGAARVHNTPPPDAVASHQFSDVEGNRTETAADRGLHGSLTAIAVTSLDENAAPRCLRDTVDRRRLGVARASTYKWKIRGRRLKHYSAIQQPRIKSASSH